MVKYVIYDLDNTLYDTWPTLLKRNRDSRALFVLSEVTRLIRLKSFTNVKNHIKQSMHAPDYFVVFLSARNKLAYIPTLLRLIFDFGNPLNFKLILVPTALQKIAIIKNLMRKNEVSLVVDDLSYNHENGDVKIYDEVVKEILDLNIKILTGNELLVLQSRNDGTVD